MEQPGPLRIALLSYRGNPTSGGQGVYVRNLSSELVRLGHRVDVLSGPPYPELAEGVGFLAVPSLDLYRQPDPFRWPRRAELQDRLDVLEAAIMLTGGFPEPLTFSLRARRLLWQRRRLYDVVHDNQSLGSGLLGMIEDGWPLVATVHHPLTRDLALELAAAPNRVRAASLRRWYRFVRMQRRVASRLPKVLTVSQASAADVVADLGVPPERLAVVPVGVDTERFRPLPPWSPAKAPGRVIVVASSDAPLKGLVPLLEAMAKLRTERDSELIVVGKVRPDGPVAAAVERLDLSGAVTITGEVGHEQLVEHYRCAEVAVVPSLYEGFSLPAVEAMACGLPLVATTGGALPEVAGPDGEAALLVPPEDPASLAGAIGRLLDDSELRARLGAAGRARAVSRFTWRACAAATLEQYRTALAEQRPAGGPEGLAAVGEGYRTGPGDAAC